MSDTISEARTEGDYAAFATQILDYVEWCRQRHEAEYPWLTEITFGHQSLDEELKDLPAKYGPRMGKVLIARNKDEVSGVVAYRKIGPDICEMKRLFVPERHLGKGLGKRLCAAIIQQAKLDGFVLMRLDTGILFREAIALYRSLGFIECAPYNQYPDRLMPLMVFMELRLESDQSLPSMLSSG